MDRLFLAVLGNRDSGKSTTWNTLFGGTVRTGKQVRHLQVASGKCVQVFLISGSFEERQLYAGEVLDSQHSRIVLCSVQYIDQARRTFEYIQEGDFDIFVQWLNPGHADNSQYFDRLGFAPWLLSMGANLVIRDGKVSPVHRVEEIRQFIHGWAEARGLTFNC